jgi:hypothetical protein
MLYITCLKSESSVRFLECMLFNFLMTSAYLINKRLGNKLVNSFYELK